MHDLIRMSIDLDSRDLVLSIIASERPPSEIKQKHKGSSGARSLPPSSPATSTFDDGASTKDQSVHREWERSDKRTIEGDSRGLIYLVF